MSIHKKPYMDRILLYFDRKYNGDRKKIAEAIVRREEIDDKVGKELQGKHLGQYTTFLDDDHPSVDKSPPGVVGKEKE